MRSFTKLIQDHLLTPVISVLFPSDCPVCREQLDKHHSGGICLECWASIKIIRAPYCSRCGLPFRDRNDSSPVKCLKCRTRNYHFSYARAFGEYSGTLKEIISLYKFSKKSHLSAQLSAFMAKAMDTCAKTEDLFGNIDMIVPVPLHSKRRRQRGFDQSLLIAIRIGRKIGMKVERSLLIRTKDCTPQSDLPASKRGKNVEEAFTVRNIHRLDGKSVLLIDDIFTTGSTVSECARVLRQAGANRVCVFTIAHTPLSLQETVLS